MALAQVSQNQPKPKPSKLENAVKIMDIGTSIAGMATGLKSLYDKKTPTGGK